MLKGFQKGHPQFNTGRTHFKKGHKLPEELELKRRKSISIAKKGKPLSEANKQALSISHKGYIMPEGQKKKMSETHKRIGTMPPHYSGEKHPNWKGGLSLYPTDWTEDLKEAIRKRDDSTCQMCGIHQDELGRKLDVHHKDYNKLNLNPENLIALCNSCHIKTNYNRNYWIDYFNKFNKI